MKYGMDPENQLCTDDFAGHLAHNVNLSVKAIMGIEAFALLNHMTGREEDARQYTAEARRMARSWVKTAANGDGTYRLAFDQEGSVSMKYNMVWDKVWGTGIFPQGVMASEIASYLLRSNQYGLPLDSRAAYTKSDWLVWCAAMTENKEDFETLVEPLWLAYHESPSRVPLTDFYDTLTAKQVAFQNRTVQGGLFMPLLLAKGICKKG
jgi:glycogen debranching enzyme